MELLDNIFSSPEKSPVRKSPAKSPLRRNVNRENLALGTSEEMEIQQSRRSCFSDSGGCTLTRSPGSFPGPFEALSARRLVQNEKTKLLPPSRMRSPIKTHLGSSPRRQSSVAPASPQRDAAGTPFRGLTESAVTRRLDFDMDVPVASVERDTAVAKGSNENQLGDKRQSLYSMEQDSPLGSVAKRTHDLAVTVDAFYEDGETNIPIDGVQNDNGEVSHAGGFADEISEDTKPKWHDQTEVYPVEATALSSVDHNPIAAEMDDLDSTLAPQKRKRGQSNASASELPASKRASNPSIPTKERSAALSYYEPHDDPVSAYEMTGYGEDSDVSVYEPEPEPEPKQPEKRDVRGKLHVHVDDDSAVDVTEGPVTARPKKAASKARKPTHKQPPKRNPSKVPARTSARPESVGPQPGQRQPSKPRSLQILRAGTPSEEDTTFRTRSGRQSVQPVNWWKGERVERSFDGTIKEIIRAEDVQVEQRPVKRVRGHRNVSVLPEVEEEEEDDEPDEWELNGGMLRTMVAQYDPDTKTGNEESLYEHGMWALYKCVLSRLLTTKNRYSLCSIRRCHARGDGRAIQLCEALHATLVWQRHRGDSTWRLQAREKFEEDADGFLRAYGTHLRDGCGY